MKDTTLTTNKIIDFLNWSGHHAWRNHTVGIGRRRLAKTSLGVGDIICVLKGGQHLEVEVKTDRDKPRKHQTAHADKIRERGGIYWFVKDFEDFFEQLKGSYPYVGGRNHTVEELKRQARSELIPRPDIMDS